MTLMRNIPASGPPADLPLFRTPEPPPEPPVFRFQIRRSLRIHRRLALAVALFVFAAVVGAHFLLPRTYTAQSLVYVQPDTPSIVGPQQPAWAQNSLSYDAFMQQQVQAVTRPDILEAAVASAPPGVWRQPKESLQMAAFRLGKAVQAERQGTSYQISISLTGKNPQDVAQMVNILTSTFLAAARHDQLAGSDTRIKILREERTRIQDALNSDMAEKANLAKQLGVSNPTPGPVIGDPWTTQLNTLEAQLATARDAHDQAAAQLTALVSKNGLNSPALAAAADQIIQSDSGLNSMKKSLNSRRAALISQMSTLGQANPVWQQDQTELKQIQRALATMTASLRARAAERLDQTLRSDLAKTAATEAQLNHQLNTLTAQATTAAPKLERASQLTTDITRLQQRFTTIEDSLNNLQLEAHAPGSMHLSSAAQVPLIPNGGLRHKLLLLALPLALFLGILAAVLATLLDDRIYTPADVEHLLGFPPMALLPDPDGVPAPVRDEFVLRLAAAVAHAAATSSARTWVVTSAGDLNVSQIITEVCSMLDKLGTRALAVTSSQLLDPRESAAPSSLVAATSPFGGAGMAGQNLRLLRDSWDLILVETPPILLSGAAEYLARFADATLLVVASGTTAMADLKRAARLLERIHAPGVAALITGISKKTAEPEFLADLEAIEERLAANPEQPFAPSGSRPILRNPDVELQPPVRDPAPHPTRRDSASHPAPIVEAIAKAVEALASAAPPHAAQPSASPQSKSGPEPAAKPAAQAATPPPAKPSAPAPKSPGRSPAKPAEPPAAHKPAPAPAAKPSASPIPPAPRNEGMDRLLDQLLSASAPPARPATPAAPPAEPLPHTIHPAPPAESAPFTPPPFDWQTQEITDPKAFPPRRSPAEPPTWLRSDSDSRNEPVQHQQSNFAAPAERFSAPPPPARTSAPPAATRISAENPPFVPPPFEWQQEVADPKAFPPRRPPAEAPAWLQTQTFIEPPQQAPAASRYPERIEPGEPPVSRPSSPEFSPSGVEQDRVSRPASSMGRRSSSFDLSAQPASTPLPVAPQHPAPAAPAEKPREEIRIDPVPSHQPTEAVPETAGTSLADQPHTHRRLGDYLFGKVVQTDGDDLNILPPTMPGQYRIRRRRK